MARKPLAPKASRPLSSSAQASAIARLEARIKELRDLSVANLTSGDDPSVSGLESRISSTLASIYGEDSSEYERPRIADIGAINARVDRMQPHAFRDFEC
jgi:hypothetical protein